MIVPASSGFHLLGADEIPGVVLPKYRVLDRPHQAGVKTDPVQFFARAEVGAVRFFAWAELSAVRFFAWAELSAVRFFARAKLSAVQRLAHLVEEKAVISKQFIAAVSPQRATPVVPQDQGIVLRRIIACAVIDEFSERLSFPHVRGPAGLRGDPHSFSPREVQDIIRVIRNIADPAPAAAGVKEQVCSLVVKARVPHLLDVRSRRAEAALQIGADDVDHDGVFFDFGGGGEGGLHHRIGSRIGSSDARAADKRPENIGIGICCFLSRPRTHSPVKIVLLFTKYDQCMLFICNACSGSRSPFCSRFKRQVCALCGRVCSLRTRVCCLRQACFILCRVRGSHLVILVLTRRRDTSC